MPANNTETETDASTSEIPDAYARDETPDGQSADGPMTLSDLHSESAQSTSNASTSSSRDPDASVPAAEAADSDSAARAGTSTGSEESPATTRELDAVKTEILEGIGRYGDRRWSTLGAYQTSMNEIGRLVKIHLADGTWYCLLEEEERGLTTRYTVQAVGRHVSVEPLLPDMETVLEALASQRRQDVSDGQAEPVDPLSADQLRLFKWRYAHLTMETFQQRQMAAERWMTETQLTLYSRYVITPVDVAELRTRVDDVVSSRQMEVVVDALWEAADANPTIPHQLLAKVDGDVPLVGRLDLR